MTQSVKPKIGLNFIWWTKNENEKKVKYKKCAPDSDAAVGERWIDSGKRKSRKSKHNKLRRQKAVQLLCWCSIKLLVVLPSHSVFDCILENKRRGRPESHQSKYFGESL